MIDSIQTDSDWSYVFPCDDSTHLPSFELLWGGHWFEVTRDDYVVNIGGTWCSLCLTPYSD